MCFSGTRLALCFRYKLLTLSTGNTVILDFYRSKRLRRFPLKCWPNAGMASPFSQRKAGILCTAIVTDSSPSSSPSSTFQRWQRLPPLHAATRPARKLHGMPRAEEVSGGTHSPACLARDELPSRSGHQAHDDHTGMLPSGKGLEQNSPWLQADRLLLQETSPSHKLVENTALSLK